MEDGNDNANFLATACQDAFQLFPHDCSHAVWHVIRQYKPDQPYMQANELVSMVRRSLEWNEVQLSELSILASAGALVIGGLQNDPNGHVIVVYPGPEKPKGGFFFIRRSTGERKFSAVSGMYARAMSTSMARNPYPGALSLGEKTVRDPWSEADFKKVRFWQYVGTVPGLSHRQKEEAKKYRNPEEEIWI